MRQILLRDSGSRVANSKFRINRIFGCSDIYASVFTVFDTVFKYIAQSFRHPIRIAVCKPGSINFEMHIFQLRHDFQRLNRSVNNCRKFGMFPAESDRIRIEPCKLQQCGNKPLDPCQLPAKFKQKLHAFFCIHAAPAQRFRNQIKRRERSFYLMRNVRN